MKYNLTLKRPSEDQTSILFIAYINKRRIKIGLGVAIPTKSWDKDNQRLKARANKDLIALQNELDNAVQAIVNLHNQLVVNDGVELSVETMREGVKRLKGGKEGASEKVLSFNQWVDDFMVDVEAGKRFVKSGTALRDGTIKRYRVVHSLLEAFKREKRGNRQIQFADVDTKFVADWKRWRADGATIGRKVIRKPIGVNTLKNDMKILKVWLKESYMNGIHDNRIWERNEMKMSAVKPTRVRLSIDELTLVEIAEFDHLRKGNQGPRLTAHNAVRDMFLLACWTAARISDVKRFPELIKTMWDDNGGACPKEIEIIQVKTNTPAFVPVLPPARRIIEKYNGALPKLPNEQKVNRYIKEVIKAAGITRSVQRVSTSIDGASSEMVKLYDMISFHDARRTCLTNLYLLDVLSVAELMLISGHSTEAQFFGYIEVDEDERRKRMSEKLLAATQHL